MVTVYKSEWHQVEKQYSAEITEEVLAEIYIDLSEEEIAEKMQQLKSGELTMEELEEAAFENSWDIEWEYQDEDWWTERKGGYEVTYRVEGVDE